MGNACKRCFGLRRDKRKFIRAKYTMTKDFSIEFENLVEEDVPEEFVRSTEAVPDEASPFTVASYMKWLAAQEEALRMEEEAYYAERRAAATLARQQRAAGGNHQTDPLNALPPGEPKSDWSDVELDDEAFEEATKGLSTVRATGTTDSEEFLRRASSGAAPTTSAHSRLLQQRLAQGFGDFQSVSSGREASIDLDWDHEPGMNPGLAEGMARSATEEDLTRLAVSQSARVADTSSPSVPLSPASNRAVSGRGESPASLVWEHDPVMDFSRRHLLAEDMT